MKLRVKINFLALLQIGMERKEVRNNTSHGLNVKTCR